MFCSNCGNKLDENSIYCTNCGFKINYQNNSNISNNKISIGSIDKTPNKSSFDRNKKIILLILLAIIIVMLSVIAFLVGKNDRSSKDGNGSRTIMIYMAGSNLESDAAIATSELDSINPDSIDLNNINVLVYTGGTLKWHNYVDANENAIYQLTESGFKKIETYEKLNLGDPSTFANYLTYVYDNFKTDNYDLVIWDHGLGVLGAVSDAHFNDDILSSVEIIEALEKSSFNKNNKFSTVSFRTCLNGTVEIASIFADYANYLVASEEITWGSTGYSVLNYINDISEEDTGLSYSKKFVNAYQEQIELLDTYNSMDATYAIIDLTLFDELVQEFNQFISDIDLAKNYDSIAKLRSNLHQYAVEESNSYLYDTVDLYELVDGLKNLSPNEAQDVLDVLEEMIVYNWAKNDSSNGLAVYFPYNGSDEYKKIHLQIYEHLDFSDEYEKFINKFYNAQKGASRFNFDLTKNETKLEGTEFTLKLSESQVEKFAKAGYIIFKKNQDGNYQPILNAMDATLTDDGYVKTNITNNLIRISDNKDSSVYDHAMVVKRTNDKGEDEYSTTVILWDLDKFDSALDGELAEDDEYAFVAQVTFKIDENNIPYIANTLVTNGEFVGATVNFDDYDVADFSVSGYKILDSNGNYTENWETHNFYYGFEVNPKEKDYVLSLDSLDVNDVSEYYCIFKIFDVNNNYYYSDLIKIN